mmetsp:Transcript_23590/g.54389  ORF Transcript_23590/g.54389 Transcript_23590/m.54389 type:complete len:752 (-) Transcript_23590:178-2433(-)|eukprot:CAMPEP_0182562358 /NCGR_PEP_ID=MMETSP1324-20130603/4709_1 /TAXON_ID=236786 /ORGANISM="Florenciella sp., Strain RCC1587" /LENGTH=751 /DNA_ID=CAMNT_0024775293 /DNA_START=328 /DNA_END=2583 /DNA_ORIENTATION=+
MSVVPIFGGSVPEPQPPAVTTEVTAEGEAKTGDDKEEKLSEEKISEAVEHAQEEKAAERKEEAEPGPVTGDDAQDAAASEKPEVEGGLLDALNGAVSAVVSAVNGEAVDEAAVERGGGGAEDGAEGGTSAHVAADDEAAGRTRLESDELVEPDSARSRLESDELVEPDSADTFNKNNRERRDSQTSADGAVSDISSSNSTPPLLGQVTPQSTSDSLNGDFTFLHEGDTRTVSYLCQDGSNGQDGDVVLGSWKGDPMKVWRVDSMNAFGFRVGSEGRVTRVSLDYRKARSKERPVPEDLSSLNDLKALDYLRIRGLPPLEQFDLRLPSGEINPRQEFFPRDVSFLVNLAKQNTLKELHLIDLIQPERGLPSPLAGFTNLTSLHVLQSYTIGNMATVGTLVNLTSLSFGLGRETVYLDQLAALTKLKHLYMENCHFLEGTMEAFGGFRNLELLEIQNCWRLGGTLEPLSHCKDLKALTLQACVSITGTLSPIGKLVNLEHLDLHGCKSISGELNQITRAMKHLRVLHIAPMMAHMLGDMEPNSLVGHFEGLAYLNKHLIQVIDLSGAKKMLGEISMLDKFHNLTTLDMRYTSIDPDSLGHVGHCVNLEYLLLSKTRIHGPLKKLSNCVNLRHLDVRECRRLKGELSDLRNMTKLTHLFTNLTAIEGEATDVKLFRRAVELHLVDNVIRGALPTFIRDTCQNLKVLDLTRCRELIGPIPDDLMMDQEQKHIRLRTTGCPDLKGQGMWVTDMAYS